MITNCTAQNTLTTVPLNRFKMLSFEMKILEIKVMYICLLEVFLFIEFSLDQFFKTILIIFKRISQIFKNKVGNGVKELNNISDCKVIKHD